MSDPNRPKTQTLSEIQAQLASGLPDTYRDFSMEAVADMANFEGNAKKVEYLQGRLGASRLDMDLVPTVALEREYVGSEKLLEKKGTLLATADYAQLTYRKRTAAAKGVVNAFFAEMPENGPFLPHTKAGVQARNDKYLYVHGGVHHTVGRLEKAYPRVGHKPVKPPTAAEAQLAVRRCGIDVGAFDPMVRGAFPLNPVYGEAQMKMNMKADNGFPVGGTMSDPRCQGLVLKLAVDMRQMFVQAFGSAGRDGVYALVRQMEERRPCLVAVKGKAKADMYSKEKIAGHMMRFYNAFPRQVVMNMQMSTQRLEALKRSALYVGNSAAGIALVHGGADALISELDHRLERVGHGYVHLGDDTFLALRTRFGVLLLSLDCSNFDLTQHGKTTAPVHEAIYQELALIDGPSAAVWYAFARERLVVVMRTLVRRFKHAGPSGMPLQSTVNDVLMEILCSRLIARWPKDAGDFEVLEKTDADSLIGEVGRELGFAVRLEDYEGHGSRTIREELAVKPFLFVGYRFYLHETGVVAVYADVPRSVVQMQYPTSTWVPDKGDLKAFEAVRLSSIIMSLGVPPPELRAAHEAARTQALHLLEQVLSNDLPKGLLRDIEDNLGSATIGFELADKSLRGLLRALQRPPEPLWLQSEMVQPDADTGLAWADIVEETEKEVARLQGISLERPKAGPLPRSTVLKLPEHALAHPATSKNDGRPPPTARWAPDKEPRPQSDLVFFDRPPRRRGGRKGGRGMAAADFGESESLSEDSEDYYY